MIKYNHEFEVVEGKYIADSIGKIGFNCETPAVRQNRLYTVDLSKSSNFYVNIINYPLTTNWIRFDNHENVHRFDIIIDVNYGTALLNGNIRFGNGTNSYLEPQFDQGTITQTRIHPKLFWPYGSPYEVLGNLRTNKNAIITFRYGNIFSQSGLEEGFIGYIPIIYDKIQTTTTTTPEPTTTTPEPTTTTPEEPIITTNDYVMCFIDEAEPYYVSSIFGSASPGPDWAGDVNDWNGLTNYDSNNVICFNVEMHTYGGGNVIPNNPEHPLCPIDVIITPRNNPEQLVGYGESLTGEWIKNKTIEKWGNIWNDPTKRIVCFIDNSPSMYRTSIETGLDEFITLLACDYKEISCDNERWIRWLYNSALNIPGC